MRARAILFVAVVLAACGGDDGSTGPDAGDSRGDVEGGPTDPFPELACPGDEGCSGSGDGTFRVGAARADINPVLTETEWDDVDEDGLWDSDESFTDDNDNGEFDATWIAGFGNARPAVGFHDDLWVRAIALEWNDIRVAIAVIDSIGWFANEMDATRELLDDALELDHVIIASTHVHEGVDTIGLWGRKQLETGIDPDYQALVRERTAQAVTAAVGDLEEATMTVAQVETVDEGGSTLPWVGDNRDPIIIDPTLTVMQFQSVANPGQTVATMVHWAAHPEYTGSRNNLLSADFVYWVRDAIENGAAANEARGLPALEGLGGEVVFLNGAVGGQIGPNGIHPIGPDGEEVTDDGFPQAEAVGLDVGRMALEAITDAELAEDVAAPDLAVRTGRLNLVVENTFYHVGGLTGVFDRGFFGYDDSEPIDEDNLPYIESRVTYLEIGSVGIATAPGELHPELFIGGYDGSHSYGIDIVHPDNPNPPLLEQAPDPPYLKDLVLMNEGVEYALLFGMADDYIGYIVPEYNFVLDDSLPYVEEAEGDHYEETNSVGSQADAQAVGAMREIVTWRRN